MLALEFKALDLVASHKRRLSPMKAMAINTRCICIWSIHWKVRASGQTKHRLLQVFSNLISNGSNILPTGGTVVISVCRRVGRFRVSIRNCGHPNPRGISPTDLSALCSSDSSDTREKGGTGLGLSITQGYRGAAWRLH